jgi:plasmid stability protein
VAVLNIRNLPAEVHARLRVRAARGGRSMEAEARAILAAVCRMDFLWNWRVLATRSCGSTCSASCLGGRVNRRRIC